MRRLAGPTWRSCRHQKHNTPAHRLRYLANSVRPGNAPDKTHPQQLAPHLALHQSHIALNPAMWGRTFSRRVTTNPSDATRRHQPGSTPHTSGGPTCAPSKKRTSTNGVEVLGLRREVRPLLGPRRRLPTILRQRHPRLLRPHALRGHRMIGENGTPLTPDWRASTGHRCAGCSASPNLCHCLKACDGHGCCDACTHATEPTTQLWHGDQA